MLRGAVVTCPRGSNRLQPPSRSIDARKPLTPVDLDRKGVAKRLSAVVQNAAGAVGRWTPNDFLRPTLRQSIEDACEGAVRLTRSFRLPTQREVSDFFGRQVLVNCVAWAAGMAAAGLVTWFFEVRGLGNLWGLLPTGGRTLVTAEDYQLILSLTSFCAGMSMMVFVRHILFRWIAEVRLVRRERVERLPGFSEMPAAECLTDEGLENTGQAGMR